MSHHREAATSFEQLERVGYDPAPMGSDGDEKLEALRGPCPCTCCRLNVRCAVRLEACAAYGMFHHGLPESRWRLAPRAPSTALYAAIFDPRATAKVGRPRLGPCAEATEALEHARQVLGV